jgi:hypothetical protein
MQIEIFTEDSGTTADEGSVEQVENFFRGGFLPIKDLSTELSPYGDVSIHILSEEYGYLRGSDSTSELKPTGGDGTEAARDFSEALSEASQTADVIVILLTKPVFEETVTKQWEALVSNTKPSTIWCIGASRNAVSSVDVEMLQSEVDDVIVYQRVGVARISTEYKDELIETVDQASDE